ncbi:tetratricopeptide repeat protein [Kribbella sp. NBC_00482]|uniref:tetratricopeptide repeat protein n=1 Tax=Kribbella sp. NBC_00482 TaxID=2975968 RepID=UPI002E1913BD
MLKCSHGWDLISVNQLAEQGRFEDVVDGGLEVLVEHEPGDRCRSRLMLDLLPFTVAIDHVELGELLCRMLLDEGDENLSGRENRRFAGFGGPLLARFDRAETADEALEAITFPRLRSRELQLQAAEIRVRRSAPVNLAAVGTRATGLRRSRNWAAAISYGRALIAHDQVADGRAVLNSVMQLIEQRDPGVGKLLESVDRINVTSALPDAMNRWSWARSVLCLTESANDPDDQMQARLLAVGRLFEQLGHPLGAAKAYSTLARLRANIPDAAGTLEATADALRQTETRIRAVAMQRLAREWTSAVDEARTAALSTSAAVDEFVAVRPATHWLGDPMTLEARMVDAAGFYRAWFVERQAKQLRGGFETLLEGAVRCLLPVGAAGSFSAELVQMRRDELDPTDSESVRSLGRALIRSAEHYRSICDYDAAVAPTREALELFLQIGTPDAVEEGNDFLWQFLRELLTGGHQHSAVRVAAAFADWQVRGGRFDPVETAIRWAQNDHWWEVVEELTSIKLEWLRSVDPASTDVVETMVLVAQLRDDLRPAAGVPVSEDAIALLSGLQCDDPLRKLVARVCTLGVRSRQFARAGQMCDALELADGVWAEVLASDVDLACQPPVFASFIDMMIGLHRTDDDATATAQVVRFALDRAVAEMEEGSGRARPSIPTILDWIYEARAIDDEQELVQRLGRLVVASGLTTRDAVNLRTELAEALACLGEFGTAERNLAEALSLDADSVEAHRSMAWVRLAAMNPAEALPAIDRAIELAPKHAWSRQLRGDTLARLGRYDEAHQELAMADEMEQGSEYGALIRSAVLRSSGRPDAAVQALEAIRAGNSSSDWTRYQYGLSLAAMGSLDEAGFLFRDAIEIGSTRRRSVLQRRQRRGDPNLGLYLLAAGHDELAAVECQASAASWPAHILREQRNDLTELATIVPAKAPAAARMDAIITARST